MTIHSQFSFDPAALSPFRTVEDISGSTASGEQDLALSKMACFVSRRLATKDANLGRAGPVCPFARKGAASGGIRFADCTALPGEEQRIVDIMAGVRDEFLIWGETSGISSTLRAYVVTFSALDGPEDAAMIERVQKRLKPEYVKCGLMIGQFYPGCDEGGIRNPEFRPLDAPVISLAVRFMALADAPFLVDDARYRAAYVAQYGEEGEGELAQALKTRTARAG